MVAVDRSATTLILACATPTGSGDEEDEEEDECGLFPSQRMVVGPSTYVVILFPSFPCLFHRGRRGGFFCG